MRNFTHFRKSLTFRFANGVSGAGLISSLPIPCAGEMLHLQQKNSSNTGAKTAQLELVDRLGNVIWDGTAKAHNTTTNHEFVSARRIIADGDTLRCTMSGDPGTSGAKIDVVVSLYGRDA